MNWQYLKYFAAVAEEEHFTRAAAKLFITQPALSKAMDNLENEIGVPLFMKVGRNIKLTPFGKVLKGCVLNATQTIEGAIAQINSMASSEAGVVRVASIFTLGSNFLPRILSKYLEQYHKVHLHYNQKATQGIIDDVNNGHIDIGFCGDFVYNEFLMNIDRKLIRTEELFVVVPETHRLADRECVSFSEVIDETFVGWNSSTGIALSIKKALREAGIAKRLKFSFAATEDNTVAEMVRQGFGISLLADVSSINMANLRRIKLVEPSISRDLYMIWKTDAPISPSVKSFMEYVHKVIEAGD